MISIRTLALELMRRTQWQQLPCELTEADYCRLILDGIRDLLVLSGRASVFDPNAIVMEYDVPVGYMMDLQLDEDAFVLLSAEIGFYRMVQSNVNNIVGYTTDALSVTNADKPYQYLSTTIKEMENKRRVIYYKMTRFNML